MNNFNPNALVFVIFTSLVGYLIGDSHGAVVGATVGVGIVLTVTILG